MRRSGRFILIASTLAALILATQLIAGAASNDYLADRVLGQPGFTSNTQNNGTLPTDGQLFNPRGISVVASTGRLYVADAENDRVRAWDSAASFSNGAAASIIITGDLNSPGLSLQKPSHMVVDGLGALYIADTVNNRVLKFNAPITNSVVASVVLGQPNFNSSSGNAGSAFASAQGLNAPFALAVDANNNLFVGDTFNNRVLRFNAPVSTYMSATVVLGQPNFTSNAFNQCNCFVPSASSLNNPTGLALDGQGNLYVSDINNNRILRYTPPFTNGMAATRVLGQANFTSSAGGTSATQLSQPRGLVVNSIGNIFVADSANNRILEFLPLVSNNMAAVRLMGQPNFSSGAQNYPNPPGSPTSSNFSIPFGVALDSAQNFYTVENLNNRVLGFDKPISIYFFPLVAR